MPYTYVLNTQSVMSQLPDYLTTDFYSLAYYLFFNKFLHQAVYLFVRATHGAALFSLEHDILHFLHVCGRTGLAYLLHITVDILRIPLRNLSLLVGHDTLGISGAARSGRAVDRHHQGQWSLHGLYAAIYVALDDNLLGLWVK